MKRILIVFITALLLCLTSCSDNTQEKKYIKSYKELENGKVAAWTGSIYETVVLDNIKNCETVNVDFLADMFVSLSEGKVDAVAYGKVLYPNLKKEFNNLTYIEDFEIPIKYAVIFSEDAKGEQLRDKFNDFLQVIENDGRKEKIVREWIGVTEHNYEGLNEWDTSNGTFKVQCGTSTPPFIYICNGELSGYDIAIFSEFAKENKYAVEYETNDFKSLPVALNAGMCDACLSGFDITEEREEVVNYSNPTYESTIVLYTLSDPDNVPEHTSLSELDGLNVGLITGGIDEMIAKDQFPNSPGSPFTTFGDVALALQNHKIDYFMINRSTSEKMIKSDDTLYAIDVPVYEQKLGFFVSKDSQKQQTLKNELNEYIENNRDFIKEIVNKWKNNENSKPLEYELTGENGTIIFATNANSEPYSLLQNNEFCGIDIDIIKSFCKEKGYNIEIDSYDFSGIVEAVAVGKADIGGSGICITEERSEAVDFTIPYNTEDMVVIVRKGSNSKTFLDSLYESFEKNFIREDRWKLILEGMLRTLAISIFSIIFGSLLGFILYMLCRKGNKVLDRILTFISGIVDGLPTVVILMILYYVIFAKSALTGEVVSIICFSFSFGLSVYSMLKTAVKSIDIGQEEAAFSIGFNDIQTFFEIVLPQALTQFIPNYKSAMIALLKGTAIVGYIAVLDLTKMSDLIRARTYEAFFPLISTALIYLLLGKLLSLVFKLIEDKIEPQKRSKEKILRKYQK